MRHGMSRLLFFFALVLPLTAAIVLSGNGSSEHEHPLLKRSVPAESPDTEAQAEEYQQEETSAEAQDGPQALSQHDTAGYGAKKSKAVTQEDEEEECPYCPSGNCPYCRGKSGKVKNADETQLSRCKNCPSGKCPWCHGKKSQQVQQEEEEEYEDDDENECSNCPAGRCPWCGGPLAKNGKCAGCPDGRCPWCHRNIETGEGPDGALAPQRCPDCPTGKCPWCHGKSAKTVPAAYSAYNKQVNKKQQEVEEEEEEEEEETCPDCPSGRCPWCGGKCTGCPDGRCPWCHRNLKTGEGPDGSPAPTRTQKCPNCPSGKCPWCHAKNQQQQDDDDAPAAKRKGYNNRPACPNCPSGKCPWCHGKAKATQQIEVEYEYEEEQEEDGEEEVVAVSAKKGTPKATTVAPPASASAAHYGPPPNYQPQEPHAYANVLAPPSKQTGYELSVEPHADIPPAQPQPLNVVYAHDEMAPRYVDDRPPQSPQQPIVQLQFSAMPSTISVPTYLSPGPAPATPLKFRSGLPNAFSPRPKSKVPLGLIQVDESDGCCSISLPPGRYRILPGVSQAARMKRSIDNFRNRFLLRN